MPIWTRDVESSGKRAARDRREIVTVRRSKSWLWTSSRQDNKLLLKCQVFHEYIAAKTKELDCLNRWKPEQVQHETSLQRIQPSWNRLLSTRSYTASRWYLCGAQALTGLSLEDSMAPRARIAFWRSILSALDNRNEFVRA